MGSTDHSSLLFLNKVLQASSTSSQKPGRTSDTKEKKVNFFITSPLKAPLSGETMFVSFHISKRTGRNMPLGDPNEVEEMMGYFHEPTVSALSKAIYGVKNNPNP